MVKKASTKKEKPGVKSRVWDYDVLGQGEQHTLYAPALFFELWVKPDDKLKAYINQYLLEFMHSQPQLRVCPEQKYELATDDDI